MTTTRRVVSRDIVQCSAAGARVLAYVKSSRNMRDMFRKAVRALGLSVPCDERGNPIPQQDWGKGDGGCVVYDVGGTPDALAQLADQHCVIRFEACLSVPIPHRGTGSGPEPKRPLRGIEERFRAAVPEAEYTADVWADICRRIRRYVRPERLLRVTLRRTVASFNFHGRLLARLDV